MPNIELRDGVVIPESELQFRYVRSSGPGGQNVNKVSTKAELRFALAESGALGHGQKRRLAAAYPSALTTAGELVVTSDRFRSQSMNQSDVMDRLRQMILSVWFPPKPRKKTKPSKAAQRRRVADKRERGARKRERARRDFT